MPKQEAPIVKNVPGRGDVKTAIEDLDEKIQNMHKQLSAESKEALGALVTALTSCKEKEKAEQVAACTSALLGCYSTAHCPSKAENGIVMDNYRTQPQQKKRLQAFKEKTEIYKKHINKLSPGKSIIVLACTAAGALLGGLVGAVFGTTAGACIGGGAGSVVPVFGNIFGAGLGGVAGSMAAAAGGVKAGAVLGAALGAALFGIFSHKASQRAAFSPIQKASNKVADTLHEALKKTSPASNPNSR